jgi:tetratricopeptide (TPR) repeat protein
MSPSIRPISSVAQRLLAAATAAILACATITIASSGTAHAQAAPDKAKAKAFYDDAEKQYNLGKFEAAVDLYTKAYQEWPETSFLFNIAQAYRQAGNCSRALFFYKRFLSLKAADPSKPIAPGLRAEVEARITELEECNRRELANKPPDGQMQPEGQPSVNPPTKVATHEPTDDEDSDEEPAITASTTYQPHVVALRAAIGGAKMILPGHEDPSLAPVQFAVGITAGYPIAVAEKVVVDVGAHFNFMPLPYQDPVDKGKTDRASQISLLFNTGASLQIVDKIGLHLDLGLGLLRFGGLRKGSRFTAENEDVSTINMFNVRLAVSGEYAITPNVYGVVTPLAFSFSPKGSGFDEDTSLVTRFDFLVGVGYRM